MKPFQRWYIESLKRSRFSGSGRGKPPASESIVSVDISNAARYFYEEESRDFWEEERFPCIVPPWPLMWMEFKVPKFNRVGDRLDPMDNVGSHWGAFVVTESIAPDRRVHAIRDEIDRVFLRKNSPAGVTWVMHPQEEARIAAVRLQAVREGVTPHWLVAGQLFTFVRHDVILLLIYTTFLDEQGHGLETLATYVPVSKAVAAPSYEEQANLPLGSFVLPFKYALALLHCKNVEVVNEKVPAPIRKRWKKEGLPDVVYRQIVVHPMRVQKRRASGQDEPRQEPANQDRLHICRGHFKDYRDGPGLFGKYKGIYWWDHHVRGNADVGIVRKTYRVDPR